MRYFLVVASLLVGAFVLGLLSVEPAVQVEVTPAVVELGSVADFSKPVFTVVVKNASPKTVSIRAVEYSCRCVSSADPVDRYPVKLESGASLLVTSKVDPSGEVGRQSNRMMVQVDCDGVALSPKLIDVHHDVAVSAVFLPSQLVLNAAQPGQCFHDVVSLIGADQDSLVENVTITESLPDYISAKVVQPDVNQKRVSYFGSSLPILRNLVIDYTVPSSARNAVEMKTDEIVVSVRLGDRTLERSLPVICSISPPVLLVPEAAILRSGNSAREIAELRATAFATTTTTLSVLEKPPGVSVQTTQETVDGTWSITVTRGPDAEAAVAGDVTMQFDQGLQFTFPVLVLP